MNGNVPGDPVSVAPHNQPGGQQKDQLYCGIQGRSKRSCVEALQANSACSSELLVLKVKTQCGRWNAIDLITSMRQGRQKWQGPGHMWMVLLRKIAETRPHQSQLTVSSGVMAHQYPSNAASQV